MPEDNLSKAELALIDKIISAVGLAKFRNILWQKVRQAFGFSFHGTNIEYDFARATPDERALAYLEDRIFILSDKTQAKLVGDLRWELLEGMKNAESVDQIKRRLDTIFEGNTVQTERIARVNCRYFQIRLSIQKRVTHVCIRRRDQTVAALSCPDANSQKT
jgi:hypothetical protein